MAHCRTTAMRLLNWGITFWQPFYPINASQMSMYNRTGSPWRRRISYNNFSVTAVSNWIGSARHRSFSPLPSTTLYETCISERRCTLAPRKPLPRSLPLVQYLVGVLKLGVIQSCFYWNNMHARMNTPLNSQKISSQPHKVLRLSLQ